MVAGKMVEGRGKNIKHGGEDYIEIWKAKNSCLYDPATHRGFISHCPHIVRRQMLSRLYKYLAKSQD